MPKFCFVVVDQAGKLKAGSMIVEDEEEARTVIAANGLVLKDLWEPEEKEKCIISAEQKLLDDQEKSDAGQLERIIDREIQSPEPPPPGEGNQKKEPRAGRPRAATKAVERNLYAPPDFESLLKKPAYLSPYKVALFLIALALCVIVLLKELPSAIKPSPKPMEHYTALNMTVSGRLILMHGRTGEAKERLDFSNVRLCFHFPELPLDEERNAESIVTNENGDFETSFSLMSRDTPHYFCITVRGDGIEEKTLSELSLEGNPLHCTIPEITVYPEGEGEGTEL